MSQVDPSDIVSEFESFGLPVKNGSPILDKLVDIGQLFKLDADSLLNEWMAFSSQNNNCQLEAASLEIWEGQLQTSRNRGKENQETSAFKQTFSEKNLEELFSMETEVLPSDNFMSGYETPQSSSRKRQSATTPTTPRQRPRPSSTPNPAHLSSPAITSPYSSTRDNSLLVETPTGTYKQRKNSGQVVCTWNEAHLPTKWAGLKGGVQVRSYDDTKSLSKPYQFMFQKVSEKALVLLERINKMGVAICDNHNLPSPLSVAQPSLEPAVFTGQVVCEGEGHLNVRSCLLQGPSHSRWNRGACVRMELPDNVTCSLFPGQVVAVEGINNYNGMMVASRVFDEGVLPPGPVRKSDVQAFTMMCASGPFTSSDNLSYEPLHDLLAVVREEKPDVLVLLGPFLEDTHQQVQACDIPGGSSFEDFFLMSVLEPVWHTVKSTKTKLVLIPSQRDVHHPYPVYPQPPFQSHASLNSSCFSDPSTLDMNGLVVGVTSTDILFHLSARTLFKGSAKGDRMSRLVQQLLRQQCYYPLLPGYEGDNGGKMNLDLPHMFEHGYAAIPAMPDLLLLSSTLKPFAKVVDNCVCLNFGRLTKRTSGGTYAKLVIKNHSDISAQIVNI